MPSREDSVIISAAVSSINKFANDGSFMQEVTPEQNDDSYESKLESQLVSSESRQPSECIGILAEGLSANQLAAKALQLRLKGKHEEANRIMKEVENIKAELVAADESRRPQKESDARRSHENTNFPKRILTQQERCKFCFENPNRPKHLVIAIANFTYLSLPHWQSIVPGHCCISTLQHESSTRAVDNNVWDEIRNFKKCLIMMFAKQEMDIVFLETVMGLAQQKRHCMVEVIPLPRALAKAAPLYFKKAIDEAEDEWSRHNAKKLIDTSEKGLMASIPKDFPYFHVEFGLNRGFVHVIDDETQFKSSFGINVTRGMLQLPEENKYGRTKRDSLESQKQAVASFAKDWEPFDWTKQLQ